jgi:hypothetical protein
MKQVLLRSIVGAGGVLTFLVAACTEGTTPDCRSPDSGCAPTADGAPNREASVDTGAFETGTTDAVADAPREAAQEAGGGSDAGPDVGLDAALDADAQGG